ncbi:MAG: hypothetical protein AMXMBFR7_45650 [Planctomycetota bacterium]
MEAVAVDVLAVVVERAQQALSSSADAQAFLHAHGLNAPEVLSSYRVGWSGPNLLDGIDPAALKAAGLVFGNRLCPVKAPGLLLPTFDPHEPNQPVGLVKLAPYLGRHAFSTTPPHGLALPCEHAAGRTVVADHPMLLLKLAQEGVRGAVLVCGDELLEAHADWLKAREIVVASYRKPALKRMQDLLGPDVPAAWCHTEFVRTPTDSLALLGIDKANLPASKLAGRSRPKKRKGNSSVAVQQAERADTPAPAAAQTVAECGDAPPPALSLSYQPAEGTPGTQGHAEHAPAPPPAEAAAPLAIEVISPLAAEYPEKPELVTHDTRMLRAVFRAGDATYEVETAFDVGSKLEVSVERQSQKARDRFDLAKEAQRKRFATSAALRTGVPCEVVEAHLIVLLDAVRVLQAAVLDPTKKASTPAAERMSDAEREDALALLRRPDLLDAVAGELEALGWVGEESLKRLLFLVTLSRKLPDPLHAALRSPSGGGKTFALEALCAATPPEDLIRLSNLTQAALIHQGYGLRHKLLCLSESDVLEREVIVQLRVLLSEGVLRQAGTMRDAATGTVVSDFREAKGPVAFLTSTTRDLDREVLDRCYDLTPDDSEAQTQRIMEAQRLSKREAAGLAHRARITTRLRNLQRLIEPLPVAIPYADRIEFPAANIRLRREHQRFLRLIEASALLHQYQRLREHGCILADSADFEIALHLAGDSIGRAVDELSRHAAAVWALVREQRLAAFSLNELQAHLPGWTRHRIYSALEELNRVEFVTSERGRGKVRTYRPVALSVRDRLEAAVRLRTMEELSEARKRDNNFIPRAATG